MKLKVSELSHHPLNQEIYDLSNIDDLANSIQEMGVLQPLVINQFNQVVSGNRRLCAIRQLGLEEVECELVQIDENLVAKYLVHYNKQRVKTCKEILKEYEVLRLVVLRNNGKRNDIRVRETLSVEIGISNSQLGKLLFIQKEHPELIALIDREILTVAQAYLQTKRLNNEWKSRQTSSRVSIKERSDFIFHNKSSEKMIELEDGSVQTIFTSPPYFNKRRYIENGGLGNESSSNEYVDNLVSHYCFHSSHCGML